jgi:hypothetical protein
MPGPLASLTDSTPRLSVLQFPSDLGSKARSHYVQFNILEIISGGYVPVTGGGTTTILNTTGQALNAGPAATGTGITTTDAGTTVALQISPPTQNPVAYISLYMPETVVAQYEHGYQEDNLTDYALAYFGKAVSTLFDARNKLVQDVAGGTNVLNTIASNPAVLALAKRSSLSELIPVDQLLKGQGLAINPQVQLLFKATALRQFQFNFIFTPSSRIEAEEVKKIIQKFKYHAAPEIGGGAINNDLFFKMPDIFEIKFFYDGKENDKIHKIDRCVLKTIDIDYAASGGGWTAHEDGYPVQTRMTLTFEELSIQDKKQIALGY